MDGRRIRRWWLSGCLVVGALGCSSTRNNNRAGLPQRRQAGHRHADGVQGQVVLGRVEQQARRAGRKSPPSRLQRSGQAGDARDSRQRSGRVGVRREDPHRPAAKRCSTRPAQGYQKALKMDPKNKAALTRAGEVLRPARRAREGRRDVQAVPCRSSEGQGRRPRSGGGPRPVEGLGRGGGVVRIRPEDRPGEPLDPQDDGLLPGPRRQVGRGVRGHVPGHARGPGPLPHGSRARTSEPARREPACNCNSRSRPIPPTLPRASSWRSSTRSLDRSARPTRIRSSPSAAPPSRISKGWSLNEHAPVDLTGACSFLDRTG